MNGKGKVLSVCLGVVLLSACLGGCGGEATSFPEIVPTAMPAKPTSVPPPPAGTPAPVAEGGRGVVGAPVGVVPAAQRMIIKNAELTILVDDTDVAIDRITGVAAQYGGYIVEARTWYAEGYKEATVTIGVPAQYFEEALRRVREIAVRVDREAASGQDVTDEYVDLASQLRNLEATEARLRSFLEKAETVEEALQVNGELSKIVEQIEVIKGRMNYIEQRAAFSTIIVEIRPPRPTPTPTPTRTPKPTPTPVAWRPGGTFERASGALTSIVRTGWEALIWIAVVVLPVVVGPVAIGVAVVWFFRRRNRESD
jgi:hypothetical protein